MPDDNHSQAVEAMARAAADAVAHPNDSRDIWTIEAASALTALIALYPGIAAVIEGSAGWQPIETAPKDGTMLRLLVQFDGHSFEDSSEPCWTIGFNLFANTQEDRWQFAGWDWCHDCIIEAQGTPIGWLPMLAAASTPGDAKEGGE